jgi:hypothetical protein
MYIKNKDNRNPLSNITRVYQKMSKLSKNNLIHMKSNNVENVNIHVKMNRSHATISRTTNIMATKNAK